jgi:ribosomal protein S18 acetylase RimI-like enzyme
MKYMMRPARDEDEPFLYELYRSTRIDELSQTGLAPDQLDQLVRFQFTAQQHHYREAYKDAEHLIIEVDDRPVGRLLVYRSDKEVRLVDIALLLEWRGGGIGSELIGRLQEEAVALSRPLTLHVAKSNRALRLYERLGFKVVEDAGIHFFMRWDANLTATRRS